MAQSSVDADAARVRALALRLREGTLRAVPQSRLNGHREQRLANNVSISFDGADARDMLADLDAAGIACSAGAACGATTLEPSHVLLAMGVTLERAIATLRLTLGADTTAADVERTLSVLPGIVTASRGRRAGADAAG
jgi:cysteine desulfurase